MLMRVGVGHCDVIHVMPDAITKLANYDLGLLTPPEPDDQQDLA